MSAKVAVGAAAAGVLAIAAALVAPWEGYEPKPYLDIVNVLTVCYGHTGNVEQRTYTKEECEALLQSDLGKNWNGVQNCLHRPVKDHEGAAILSLAFNVGYPAVCRSTLMRKVNEGRPASEWCRELFRWNRAGGKVVRGLTNRRKAEYRVCIGLDQ